jgi:predicted phage terminase large subunit-like protein
LPAAPDGTTLANVPVRARATSNPGGPSHAWVKSRFVDPHSRHPEAIFLPSRISDNPHLDRTAYLRSLAHLPGAERERLLSGDWNVPDDGELFRRDWFQIIDRQQLPTRLAAVRYWDLAGSEKSSTNPDPDYTVGLRLEHDPRAGDFYLTQLVRVRKAPGAVERLVAATAEADGRNVRIYIEQEPGGAGKTLIDRYKRHVLKGYSVYGDRPTGAKEIRAQPVAAAAQNGLLKIVRGPHLHDLLDELAAFPNGPHDDCVDALAGAHTALARPRTVITSISSPKDTRIPGVLERRTPADRIHSQLATRLHDQIQRQAEADAQLAAAIGVPYHPPGSWCY